MIRFRRNGGKYKAKKVYEDGVKVADSKTEYRHLKLIESSGLQFAKQVTYELLPNQTIGKKTIRGVKYIADFVIFKGSNIYILDSKGVETDSFKIKFKLMAQKGNIVLKIKSDKQMMLVLALINEGLNTVQIYEKI